MVSGKEQGGEIVQFVVALPLLLLVVFSVIQLGTMTFAASRLSSEITRACRQLDVSGLERAVDKEGFVKSEILGASSQLREAALQVSDVRWRREERRSAGDTGDGALEERTVSVALSYRVRYELPSFVQVPGLSGQELSREVRAAIVEGRVVEVEVDRP
ncbi:TadE/TadG family type IV pilus assembly protein [Arabiibacter massiliensis]|uniref:TadE/TadG family type IV pilus assembly protein n=1 Tax=Arabiibacter massiliensis TaxID=1870985 RepID=UPI0009BAECD5|nr:TadE/TadG family type IV pilus assembly protein [Arabiibacter massiliensis]